MESDRWAIDDHSPPANINGGSTWFYLFRGGLPYEESHSGSGHHSLPWGLWRVTDGPLMITAPLGISIEGPPCSSCSGGCCHVRRATLALDITAFPGDYGEWPMGHWWSHSPWEYQWRLGWSLPRQEGAAMWGEPLRLWTSQPSLGTLENDQWAIDDHSPPWNINGGSTWF